MKDEQKEVKKENDDAGQGDENDENNGDEPAVKEEEAEDEKEPEAQMDPEVLARTVHLKGFQLTSTEEDIRKFVENYGKIDGEIEMIKRVDKDGGKKFRGDIFVTYSTQEEADKAVSDTEKPANVTKFWRETK